VEQVCSAKVYSYVIYRKQNIFYLIMYTYVSCARVL
jgi:hypothetical protein